MFVRGDYRTKLGVKNSTKYFFSTLKFSLVWQLLNAESFLKDLTPSFTLKKGHLNV